jgi:hypothetical protein
MGRIKRKEKPKNRSPLPIVGKIKVGKKTEQGYPTSLDYFRATGKYAEHFHKQYGKKPSNIQVIFVSDDLDSVCNERLELRDNKGDLFAYGDGETFHVWSHKREEYRQTTIEETPKVKEIAQKNAKSSKGWEVVLTLRFIIPKITGVAGMWQLTTKGKESSVPQIIEAFDFVQEQAGTVVNIPFDLEVEKVKSQKPGTKSVFPVIRLIPNIGKENMEVVKNYLSAGHEVREIPKLLSGETEEKKITGEVGDIEELEGTPFED